METWKPIPGFEGLYEVSNLGRIKSFSIYPDGKVLRPGKNLGGYNQYTLVAAGKHKRISAHLLVCTAFIGPRPAGYEINHKNGVKDDNRLENLEYVTKSQNKRHALDILQKGRGESHGNSKINEETVREIRRLATVGLKHRDIAAQFGITRANTSMIIRRVAWKHVT